MMRVSGRDIAQNCPNIQNYRVLQQLGEGGTARVYLAVRSGMGGFHKLVVLKMLKEQLEGETSIRQMFLSEARLSARLSHENIVSVNEVFEENGSPVIVMEYLEGAAYSQLSNKAGGKLSLGMRLRIIADALAGLHYSHDLTDFDGTLVNLVHRDMTPHNIFVTYDGRVKLLDFGIAKITAPSNHTETGVIKGKMGYMSPEQIAGDQLDRRADIFAVGVMIWEAATGRRMWSDVSEATIMHRVLNGQIPRPSAANPNCSPELERICMRALAPEAQERYATAAELQAELEKFLADNHLSCSMRDLSACVTNVFAEERETIKRCVEDQLRDVDTSASMTGPGFAVNAEPPEQRSRLFRVAVLAMAFGAALSVLFVLRARSARSVRPAAPPIASVSTPAQAPVPLNVRIVATPREAKIVLDGAPLETNPYLGKKLADGAWHSVRVSAKGYVEQVQRFRLVGDVDMLVALQEEPSVPSEALTTSSVRPARSAVPPRDVRPARRAAPVPSEAKTAPSAACNPPYTVDGNGIKRYKSECL